MDKQTNRTLAGLALAAAVLLGAGAADAGDLLSGSVTVTGDYPTDTTVIPGYGPFSGPTSGGIVECCGYTFTFTGNTISYYNPYQGDYFGDGANFNGWVLKFSGVPKIIGVTNDSQSQMDPIAISFTGDQVELNFSGEYRPGPTTSIFDVTFASGAPEPATWAVMLLGVGIVGAAKRVARKKSSAAATTA